MNRIEQSVERFRAGHTCSQAVFSVYGSVLGLNEETALRIACPFGGGMGRRAEVCGAVTGAFERAIRHPVSSFCPHCR